MTMQNGGQGSGGGSGGGGEDNQNNNQNNNQQNNNQDQNQNNQQNNQNNNDQQNNQQNNENQNQVSITKAELDDLTKSIRDLRTENSSLSLQNKAILLRILPENQRGKVDELMKEIENEVNRNLNEDDLDAKAKVLLAKELAWEHKDYGVTEEVLMNEGDAPSMRLKAMTLRAEYLENNGVPNGGTGGGNNQNNQNNSTNMRSDKGGAGQGGGSGQGNAIEGKGKQASVNHIANLIREKQGASRN